MTLECWFSVPDHDHKGSGVGSYRNDFYTLAGLLLGHSYGVARESGCVRYHSNMTLWSEQTLPASVINIPLSLSFYGMMINGYSTLYLLMWEGRVKRALFQSF